MKSFFFKGDSYYEYPFYNYHPLKAAYIYVSGVCNFQCRVCSLPLKKIDTFVTLSMLKKKIRKAKDLGLGNIIFTGQEVILHPQIDAIIRWAFDEIGIDYIAIVTNGLALADDNILRKFIGLRKHTDRIYLGVSVNFYNTFTFASWSGLKKRVFRRWSLGFKQAAKEGLISYLDTILNKNVNIKKILEYLSRLTEGRSRKINLRVGEYFPFSADRKKIYKRWKWSLLETKRKIDGIAKLHPGMIEFEGFPTCVFNQKDLKNNKYFIPGFALSFENGMPVQYDPLIYETYYSGPTENWTINRRELIDSYNRMFSYISECKECYYYRKCAGIQKDYLQIYGEKTASREIRALKKANWK